MFKSLIILKHFDFAEKVHRERMIPRGTSLKKATKKIHVFYQLFSSKTGNQRLEPKKEDWRQVSSG